MKECDQPKQPEVMLSPSTNWNAKKIHQNKSATTDNGVKTVRDAVKVKKTTEEKKLQVPSYDV